MYHFRLRFSATALLAISTITAGSFLHAEDARMTPLVRAVQRCQESVVNIHTEKAGTEEGESRFFSPKSRRISGMGTGIIVDERGYIVTNYHVIHEVDQITVTLKNGETLTARPVSFDRSQDMAIIHVKASHSLPVMPMGTSSDVYLAEQVFAVGNAFGYEHTVTAGIVSALGRDVEVDETQSYENLIQTDASINPGNSGGPLLNVNGEVIGVNVAIRAGAQRIGFAIPIDDARRTIARLLSTERLNGISHGLFATDLKTPAEKKLIVDEVATGSAAEKCGLRKGDTVCKVGATQICDNADWERSLLDVAVGTTLNVEVERDGRKVTLPFTVGVGQAVTSVADGSRRTPVQTAAASTSAGSDTASKDDGRERAQKLFGLQLGTVSPQERSMLTSRRYNGGMKVVEVQRGSAAERHGIRTGDILLGMDGFETLDDNNLRFILKESRMRNLPSMSFQIYRQNQALVGSIDLRPLK